MDMKFTLGFLLRAAAALLLSGLLAIAQPVPEDHEQALQAFSAQAEQIQTAIDGGDLSEEQAETYRAGLEKQRQAFTDLAQSAADAMSPLRGRLDVLGPPPEEGEEAPEIAEQRKNLNAEIEPLEALRKRAEQAATQAQNLSASLTDLQRERFRRQILSRGDSPIGPEGFGKAWASLERQAKAIQIEMQSRLAGEGVLGSLRDKLALPLVLAVIALLIAVALRRRLVNWLTGIARDDAPVLRRFTIATGVTLARLLLPALAVILIVSGALMSGLLGPTGTLYVKAFGGGALIFVGAYALSAAFFSPGAPALRLSRLDDSTASSAHGWLLVIAAVVGLDHLLVDAGAEAGMTTDALAVMNAPLLIIGGVALWRFVRKVHLGEAEKAPEAETDSEETGSEPAAERSPFETVSRVARIVASGVAVAAPVLAIAGYYTASRFVFYPMVFSAGLIGLGLLIQHAVRALSTGPQRSGTGDTGDAGTGPAFLPVLSGMVLVIMAIPLLALIWGASVTDLDAAWAQTVEGFQVGDITLAPADFVIFAIVFTIGYLITRILKGVLRRSVLPVTRLDEGAKSAILAGVGYVGVVFSALVAISTTGLDLSNIAIVAGALSVGIGFGLQNIVNNFVSGIILLIERPIKTGDWVEIGGVHGTVRKVKVRSTEIQTFDRSTMFVPNADLISGTVTNWTHSDSLGRLIVPVGAAYGSDARQVEKILLEIAQAHPMLMRRPAPYVLFSGFGADSIDFEIRGVLRDVNWIMNVASDIRFSVYERFAAEGIEIPFAQRDLHLRSLGGLEKLIGNRPEGPREEEFDNESDGSPDDGSPDDGSAADGGPEGGG